LCRKADRPEPKGGRRPKTLKKYASHDHETYAKHYKKSLDKQGCVDELSVKGADKFWPKEKLVDVGKGQMAPRPFGSNGERREFLRRLASEKGWTFAEVNGT